MILDTKCRPPFQDLTSSYIFDVETRKRCAYRFAMELPESLLNNSMETFIEEMTRNHVDKACVPVRRFSGTCGNTAHALENDVLFRLMDTYPGRFLGVPDIDPLGGTQAIGEIEHWMRVPGICAISLEPGYQFVNANDPRTYPLYAYCQEHQIPIFLSFGGRCQRKLKNLQPLALDTVMTDFPDLTIIAVHGGWPYVQEMMWNGLIHKNLYLMPDIYMLNIPGSKDFIDAANSLLQDQIVFGSAYPCVSYDYVLSYLEKHLHPDVLDKVLCQNALKALDLEQENI